LLAEIAAAGVPSALVSSSHRVMVDVVLDSIGHSIGHRYFPVTVAGNEVTATKPAPEPYLVAAARLGVDPTRCVVLEDSPTGVASGEAAGCLTVAVPSIAPIPAVNGRVVVSSLTELDLGRLRSLVAGRAGGGTSGWAGGWAGG
jgi:beta-phosphoglucomutase-like phosphatase (HAD superfamily)